MSARSQIKLDSHEIHIDVRAQVRYCLEENHPLVFRFGDLFACYTP